MPKKVLVVGDTVLDEYISGSLDRISSEAPCPIVNVKKTRHVPGCAGNVACNVSALGGEVILLTIFGINDFAGDKLLTQFRKKNNLAYYVPLIDPAIGYVTPIYTRITDNNDKQIIRYDRNENDNVFTAEIYEHITSAYKKILANNDIDCVVLSDYGRGVLTCDSYLHELIITGRAANIPIIADPRSTDLYRYRDCTIITPNMNEACAFSALAEKGYTKNNPPPVIAKALQDVLYCNGFVDVILLTAGIDGMYLIRKTDLIHIPANPPQSVCDSTGAGDTVVACLAHEIVNNDKLSLFTVMEEIANKANIGASVVVSFPGTVALNKYAYNAALEKYMQPPKYITAPKFITDSQISAFCDDLHKKNKKVVFAPGCFDCLHAAHIKLLEEAKAQGDFLVVGINSDQSVKRLKGADRPICNIADRIALLNALTCVDAIIEFHEDTPEEVMHTLCPHVLVKGNEYNVGNIPGAASVINNGGRVHLVDMLPGYSTSATIEHIRNYVPPNKS